MDIQILREFLDLSFTLNYSKTAERVFISQSALSKHIVSLEKELGVQLFARNKQSVHLTPIGAALVDKFQKVVSEYDSALSIINQNIDDLHGSLRIGYLDAAVRNMLSETIHNYSDKYPNMKVTLNSFEVNELNDALKHDAIDIALCIAFPNSALSPNVYFRPLYNDGISAFVSKDNPLAKKESIEFAELLDYPMILPSPVQYPSYASIISEKIADAPKKANIICDFTNIATALIMVESEMGVSILPTNVSNSQTTACFLPIRDCNPVLQVGAMWKKNNATTGVEEFVSEICDIASKMFYSGEASEEI